MLGEIHLLDDDTRLRSFTTRIASYKNTVYCYEAARQNSLKHVYDIEMAHQATSSIITTSRWNLIATAAQL